MDPERPEQNVVREDAAVMADQPKTESENPWVKYAGLWKDIPDEEFEAWRAAVQEYRQECDRRQWEMEEEEERKQQQH
jgi:hypothetical protein